MDTEVLTFLVRMQGGAQVRKEQEALGRAGEKAAGRIRVAGGVMSRAMEKVRITVARVRNAFLLWAFTIGITTAAVNKFLAEAQKVSNLNRAFETLGARIGAAPTFIEDLRMATMGLVNDMELMRITNNAIILGVAKNSKQFAELARTAVILGQAVGLDAVPAIDSLVTGIGRQSRLMLDNLGIIVQAEVAYRAYAAALGKTADKLSEAERKIAFGAEAIDKAKVAAAGLTPELDLLSTKWEQLKVKISNATQALMDWTNQVTATGEGKAIRASRVLASFMLEDEKIQPDLRREYEKQIAEILQSRMLSPEERISLLQTPGASDVYETLAQRFNLTEFDREFGMSLESLKQKHAEARSILQGVQGSGMGAFDITGGGENLNQFIIKEFEAAFAVTSDDVARIQRAGASAEEVLGSVGEETEALLRAYAEIIKGLSEARRSQAKISDELGALRSAREAGPEAQRKHLKKEGIYDYEAEQQARELHVPEGADPGFFTYLPSKEQVEDAKAWAEEVYGSAEEIGDYADAYHKELKDAAEKFSGKGIEQVGDMPVLFGGELAPGAISTLKEFDDLLNAIGVDGVESFRLMGDQVGRTLAMLKDPGFMMDLGVEREEVESLTEEVIRLANELEKAGVDVEGFIGKWDTFPELTRIAAQGAADLGATLVDAAMSGDKSFGQMFKNLMRDLMKAIIRATILRAIMRGFGGGGGMAAGGIVGSAPGGMGGAGMTGGIGTTPGGYVYNMAKGGFVAPQRDVVTAPDREIIRNMAKGGFVAPQRDVVTAPDREIIRSMAKGGFVADRKIVIAMAKNGFVNARRGMITGGLPKRDSVLINAQQGESVLPTWLTSFLVAAARQVDRDKTAPGATAPPPTILHMHNEIHTIDGRSLRRYLEDNPEAFAGAYRMAQRRGAM